jgi:hypothetical protein
MIFPPNTTSPTTLCHVNLVFLLYEIEKSLQSTTYNYFIYNYSLYKQEESTFHRLFHTSIT